MQLCACHDVQEVVPFWFTNRFLVSDIFSIRARLPKSLLVCLSVYAQVPWTGIGDFPWNEPIKFLFINDWLDNHMPVKYADTGTRAPCNSNTSLHVTTTGSTLMILNTPRACLAGATKRRVDDPAV